MTVPFEDPVIRAGGVYAITACFCEYGFTYISMDLIGYRTGSMNEVIDN